jgi:hypothetical protein
LQFLPTFYCPAIGGVGVAARINSDAEAEPETDADAEATTLTVPRIRVNLFPFRALYANEGSDRDLEG